MTRAETKLTIMSRSERADVYTTLVALQLDQRIAEKPITRALATDLDAALLMFLT